MSKNNQPDRSTRKFEKCKICLGYMPIENYLGVGDIIDCYECGSSYIIETKSPLKLLMLDAHNENDHYVDDDYSREMSFKNR